MVRNSDNSCGIWALSEVLDLKYETQLSNFYTPERETSQYATEPAGVLPIELHHWAWNLGHPNRLWVPMSERARGVFHVPSAEDMLKKASQGKAILGVTSEFDGSGHWIPVRYGLFKEKKYTPWTEVGELFNTKWDKINVAIIFECT